VVPGERCANSVQGTWPQENPNAKSEEKPSKTALLVEKKTTTFNGSFKFSIAVMNSFTFRKHLLAGHEDVSRRVVPKRDSPMYSGEALGTALSDSLFFHAFQLLINLSARLPARGLL